MKDTKKVAVCLIQNEKGEYLLIRPTNYKNFGEYQDAWYPPTGHIKEGETVEQAFVRELKEELNLDIKPVELFSEWEQDIPGEWAYWWKCKIVGGTIKKSEEILDYKYFSPEEIKKLKLWPATRKFFEKFIWNESNLS
jgi:8-oxo-dGTP diphosphatase